ncbi:MAG: TonB-dependent receptor [Bacteroidales bacterium]|nr:TonB-dependent receptor [Bacteroidales bacterium]
MIKRIIQTMAVSLALLLAGLPALAQNRTVTGKVLDTQGVPVPGVAVILDGTTNGTMTNDDGSFSLKVPAGDALLTFSTLGYAEQKIVVPGTQNSVDVVLEEDNMLLQETVVVGYGTQKKVNLTGAVTAVDSKVLENRSAHSLSTMLQGSVPGLNISTSTGNPGSTGSLNIRGITSINDADPLVLIDGAVGSIDRVNPNDVESISVIKDAAAAAVYGARAAYGVILVTTKSGADKEGKATVRYSGRWGWEEPTTSTDYETRGYWSVYTVDKFWQAGGLGKYTTYNDYDMAQLLARVNDVTEDPSRPWIVEDVRNGKRQWIYYCNTDWYHELYNDRHPVTTQSVSVSGGNKNVKYFISGGYDKQNGIIKVRPDVFTKYNLRSKIDFQINKYMRLSNNTSFYSATYDFSGTGTGNVQDTFRYASRHALASFPLKNPDGSWVYGTPMIAGSYNVGNGRHIIFGMDTQKNIQKRNDFSNTTQLVITPVRPWSITANFTYRLYQNLNTTRTTNFCWRRYPEAELEWYTTGAGIDELTETISTYNYMAGNVFTNYEDTFADAHHLTLMAGMNLEEWKSKTIEGSAQNMLSETLNDLSLVGTDATGAVITNVAGGQNSYGLIGFFGRINYDYKGRYLFEASARYDGSSRFAEGHRWGFFPSASIGWRVSEEPFFAPLKRTINNFKFRASYGSLGNQNVGYYDYLRIISIANYSYTFGESASFPKKATLSAPVAGDLTWETSQQYNVGVDIAALGNKLEFTAEAYIRDTKNMLTAGMALPSVYGASSPKMNNADLRTKGYEFSLSWRDGFKLLGKPFSYSIKGTLSDYRSYITKYLNNPNHLLSDYYEGMRIGDIWGYEVTGLFASDQEAQDYYNNVCNTANLIGSSRMVGGTLAGDLIYVDKNDNKELDYGQNTLEDHGDLVNLGNSLASLQYGVTASISWLGFDVSAFFQGTGDHYWYPSKMNMAFWGPYAYSYTSFLPRNFINKCWSEENTDSYFPRPRAYSSTGGELKLTNSKYLQNIRYLRLKNLTVGYTLPEKLTGAVGLDRVRVYFTGENLYYWSPLKANTLYVDPESAYTRDTGSNSVADAMAYPWQRTFMFGVDITF